MPLWCATPCQPGRAQGHVEDAVHVGWWCFASPQWRRVSHLRSGTSRTGMSMFVHAAWCSLHRSRVAPCAGLGWRHAQQATHLPHASWVPSQRMRLCIEAVGTEACTFWASAPVAFRAVLPLPLHPRLHLVGPANKWLWHTGSSRAFHFWAPRHPRPCSALTHPAAGPAQDPNLNIKVLKFRVLGFMVPFRTPT